MNRSSISELTKLYSNQDLYTKFYVSGRSRLLKLNYYLQYFPRKGLIVDVGCGYGVLANYFSLNLPDNQIFGLDMNSKRITAAAKTIGKRGNIKFFVQDATKWDWPKCAGIMMTAFLHHISPANQKLLLDIAYQSLEENGVLLISEVDPGARPFYRYWASYLADTVLYPFNKIYFRTSENWSSILQSLNFTVEIVHPWSRFFSSVLYICRKEGQLHENRVL